MSQSQLRKVRIHLHRGLILTGITSSAGHHSKLPFLMQVAYGKQVAYATPSCQNTVRVFGLSFLSTRRPTWASRPLKYSPNLEQDEKTDSYICDGVYGYLTRMGGESKMKNLEKYEPMEKDGLVVMPHGQLAMAIRSDFDGDQFCMMMQLGKDFEGMCIPMGYWIVPDMECDVPHHWIMIDPISEYWIIDNELHYNYDAIVGETLLTWPWEIGLKR